MKARRITLAAPWHKDSLFPPTSPTPLELYLHAYATAPGATRREARGGPLPQSTLFPPPFPPFSPFASPPSRRPAPALDEAQGRPLRPSEAVSCPNPSQEARESPGYPLTLLLHVRQRRLLDVKQLWLARVTAKHRPDARVDTRTSHLWLPPRWSHRGSSCGGEEGRETERGEEREGARGAAWCALSLSLSLCCRSFSYLGQVLCKRESYRLPFSDCSPAVRCASSTVFITYFCFFPYLWSVSSPRP